MLLRPPETPTVIPCNAVAAWKVAAEGSLTGTSTPATMLAAVNLVLSKLEYAPKIDDN